VLFSPLTRRFFYRVVERATAAGERFSETEAVADLMRDLDLGTWHKPAYYASRWRWGAGDAGRSTVRRRWPLLLADVAEELTWGGKRRDLPYDLPAEVIAACNARVRAYQREQYLSANPFARAAFEPGQQAASEPAPTPDVPAFEAPPATAAQPQPDRSATTSDRYPTGNGPESPPKRASATTSDRYPTAPRPNATTFDRSGPVTPGAHDRGREIQTGVCVQTGAPAHEGTHEAAPNVGERNTHTADVGGDGESATPHLVLVTTASAPPRPAASEPGTPKPPRRPLPPPSLDEAFAFGHAEGFTDDDGIRDWWETQCAAGWRHKGEPIFDWRASLRNWMRRRPGIARAAPTAARSPTGLLTFAEMLEEMQRTGRKQAAYEPVPVEGEPKPRWKLRTP